MAFFANIYFFYKIYYKLNRGVVMAKSLTTVIKTGKINQGDRKGFIRNQLAESASNGHRTIKGSGFGHNEETSSRGVF